MDRETLFAALVVGDGKRPCSGLSGEAEADVVDAALMRFARRTHSPQASSSCAS